MVEGIQQLEVYFGQYLPQLGVAALTPVLIFAHRLSSIIGADRILVLDHGRIIKSGPHAELQRRREA